MKAIITLLAAVLLAAAGASAVPLKWTVETSRAQPVAFDQFAGATYELEAALQSYGSPLAVTGEPRLYWQTNGMGSAWWSAPATATSNRLAATWTPALDVGAKVYNCFIGVTGTVYNAAFQLRLRPSPGALPNVIEQPPRILDLEHTVVINPPWPTQADFAATTTVMRAELKDYIDAEITGAGLVSPATVTNIAATATSNVVTKAYVEDLGIESGLDTNAVRDIVRDEVPDYAATSNRAAAACAATNEIVASKLPAYYSDEIGKWVVGDFYTGNRPTFGQGLYLESVELGKWQDIYVNTIENNLVGYLASLEWHPDSASLSGYGITNAYTKTESDDAFYPKSSGTQLATTVSSIGALLNAEDARFVSTNYDSVTRLPEAYVEIRQNGNWLTIWKEMTRWNAFAGTAFDWSSWGGFHAWRTNVESEISFKADRAWGSYDSETGGLSPEGYTQISSSNILIAAGMAYQRTVTASGSVWVLQCNSGTASIGGDTNGFFRILDGDGNTQFEIVKGDREEQGADAAGISVDNSTSPPTVTIPYSVVAEEHPTCHVCTDLSAADWKSETDPGRAANVSWSGESGAWTATVQRVSGSSPLFVKATYMSGGETYINNVAPVGMSSIMLFGRKYYLGTNTISGKLVLTLSETPPAN